MSRSSGSKGPYRKPRLDIYTWMLALSLVAIIIASICLYYEVADYGDQPYQLSQVASPDWGHRAVAGLPTAVAGLLTEPQGPTEGLPPCFGGLRSS